MYRHLKTMPESSKGPVISKTNQNGYIGVNDFHNRDGNFGGVHILRDPHINKVVFKNCSNFTSSNLIKCLREFLS